MLMLLNMEKLLLYAQIMVKYIKNLPIGIWYMQYIQYKLYVQENLQLVITKI